MPRKPKAMESVLFTRVPSELLKLLDARVAEEREDHPGSTISRADVVREILYKALGGN